MQIRRIRRGYGRIRFEMHSEKRVFLTLTSRS
jgi:hypothetical protein